MPPILHSILRSGTAYAAPLLALAVAALGTLLCRDKSRRQWIPAVGALAALLGWAALSPLHGLPRLAWSPRNGPELLILPAAAACLASLAAVLLRLGRVVPVGLALLTGWWLATSPAGRAEFWRVSIITALLCWLLSRLVAGQPARGLGAALALYGGLALTGAPPAWLGAAMAGAAVWLGLLAGGPGAAAPAPVLVASIVAANLAAGRAVRGGLNLVDLTCLAACAVPPVAAWVAGRLGKNLGRVGPALAAVLAAAVAVGCAWIANRVLHR